MCIGCSLGINAVANAKGQTCVTLFDKLHYDEGTDISIVSCRPITGRTHQIRVHAQYLGHPVVNDPLYSTVAWGPEKGKGFDVDKLEESNCNEIIQRLRLVQLLHISLSVQIR